MQQRKLREEKFQLEVELELVMELRVEKVRESDTFIR